jgi:hypothetical protein
MARPFPPVLAFLAGTLLASLLVLFRVLGWWEIFAAAYVTEVADDRRDLGP